MMTIRAGSSVIATPTSEESGLAEAASHALAATGPGGTRATVSFGGDASSPCSRRMPVGRAARSATSLVGGASRRPG